MVACCWGIPIMLAPVLPPQQGPPCSEGDPHAQQGPQKTVFRAWTWPSDASSAGEQVPGLRSLLCSIGLSSFSDAADLWCREQGAAFLADLMEQTEFDDFVEALKGIGGWSPSMERRLNLALRSEARKCTSSMEAGHQRRSESCQGSTSSRKSASGMMLRKTETYRAVRTEKLLRPQIVSADIRQFQSEVSDSYMQKGQMPPRSAEKVSADSCMGSHMAASTVRIATDHQCTQLGAAIMSKLNSQHEDRFMKQEFEQRDIVVNKLGTRTLSLRHADSVVETGIAVNENGAFDMPGQASRCVEAFQEHEANLKANYKQAMSSARATPVVNQAQLPDREDKSTVRVRRW